MKKRKTLKVKKPSDKQTIKVLKQNLEESRREARENYERWTTEKDAAYKLRNALNSERQRTEKLLLALGQKKMESAVAYGRLSVLMRVAHLYDKEEIKTVDNLPFMEEYNG